MPNRYGYDLDDTKYCGYQVYILNNFVYTMGVNQPALELFSSHIPRTRDDCAYAHQPITSKRTHHTQAFHSHISPNTSVARRVILTIHRTYNYKDNVYISKLVEGTAWV